MQHLTKIKDLFFDLESNLLDNVLHHKKLTVREIKELEVYLTFKQSKKLIERVQKEVSFDTWAQTKLPFEFI
jgi:hypothetical protein